MTGLTLAPPGAEPPLPALEPLIPARHRWPIIASGVISLLLLAGLVRELVQGGLGALHQSLPTNPLFYVVFAAIYAVQPLSDFVIFRRLWGLPAAGIAPILRKMVANEILLGYSGEAYFYAWARARLSMVAAPFAAIKDVSILSAVAGNVFTLGLLGLAAPFAYTLLPAEHIRPILGSAAIMLMLSLAILLFRGRLFSLPARDLRWVFLIHLARTFVYTALLALCWHLALPLVPLALWLLLVTGRQLVARLPLVPNKDILFANFALFFVGSDAAVMHLVALTVALTLLCHILVLVLTWVPFRKEASAWFAA